MDLVAVLRIQNHAQVIFSDPIVIRYGNGVQNYKKKDGKDGPAKLPCPVLEFRVVNRLWDQIGGEIMDARLNVVADIEGGDEESKFLDSMTWGSRSFLRERSAESTRSAARMVVAPPLQESPSASKNHQGSVFLRSNTISKLLQRHHLHTADAANSNRLMVNKRAFHHLMIEVSEHPFFKRVWLARHVIDDSSPLLKPKVRQQIRKNMGYWPENLNSYEAVRSSLQFNQLLVSLNGVSNVSAAGVYAQKVYDFMDVHVGYQFVGILYKDADGTLEVDEVLINDVRQQQGGGGEPLILGK
jgi:hypothetical protein